MYAIIDTEGSGLFQYKDKETGKPIPADAEGQPRLAQFAAILTDNDMNETSTLNWLVRPDGWEMSPEATLVNGLTTERLIAEGVPVDVVLDAYTKLIEDGYEIIAYNSQHDCKHMRAELRRAGRDDLFAKTRNACAMRAAMSMKIKNEGGRGFPALAHVCNHFGIPVEPRPHNAIYGARSCFEVVRCLRAANALPEPAVHFAKSRTEAA